LELFKQNTNNNNNNNNPIHSSNLDNWALGGSKVLQGRSVGDGSTSFLAFARCACEFSLVTASSSSFLHRVSTLYLSVFPSQCGSICDLLRL